MREIIIGAISLAPMIVAIILFVKKRKIEKKIDRDDDRRKTMAEIHRSYGH